MTCLEGFGDFERQWIMKKLAPLTKELTKVKELLNKYNFDVTCTEEDGVTWQFEKVKVLWGELVINGEIQYTHDKLHYMMEGAYGDNWGGTWLQKKTILMHSKKIGIEGIIPFVRDYLDEYNSEQAVEDYFVELFTKRDNPSHYLCRMVSDPKEKLSLKDQKLFRIVAHRMIKENPHDQLGHQMMLKFADMSDDGTDLPEDD